MPGYDGPHFPIWTAFVMPVRVQIWSLSRSKPQHQCGATFESHVAESDVMVQRHGNAVGDAIHHGAGLAGNTRFRGPYHRDPMSIIAFGQRTLEGGHYRGGCVDVESGSGYGVPRSEQPVKHQVGCVNEQHLVLKT